MRSISFAARSALACHLATAAVVLISVSVSGCPLRIEQRAGGDGGGPRCVYGTGSWQLGALERLDAVNSDRQESEPRLGADQRSLYFLSERGGSGVFRIYVARRAHRDAPFGQPEPVFAEQRGRLVSLHESDDGTAAVLAAELDHPAASGDVDLWLARRTDTSVGWSLDSFEPLQAINSADPEYDPVLFDGVEQIYFASRDGPAGLLRLFVADRAAAGKYQRRAITELAAAGRSRSNPTLSPDGRVIIFSTSTADDSTTKDLMYATRTGPTAPFGAAAPVPTLNTRGSDGEPALSRDGCELFFASDRESASGGFGRLNLYRIPVIRGP